MSPHLVPGARSRIGVLNAFSYPEGGKGLLLLLALVAGVPSRELAAVRDKGVCGENLLRVACLESGADAAMLL